MSFFDPATIVPLIVTLAVAGALIGFLAGVFGIGGGAISVPVFYQVFQQLGYSQEVSMPMAVGTSLAIIIPTSINASRGHYKRGTMDMSLLKVWLLPVLAGVVIGAVIARDASPRVFQLVFMIVAIINATKLLSGGSGWQWRDSLPSLPVLSAYGGVIGLSSALMGIGGGALSNLVMTLHGKPILQAVSTSAGVGVLIAVPGTLGYMLAGWGRADLPADALGFVWLAPLLVVVPASLLTTGLGVRLAHFLTRRQLETAFGIFLVLVSVRFLVDFLGVG
ncbi:MAG: sulfite exporter TauE/SafE family protein [Granulosicoccus sp.]|nr:sulfite exporter TauE/SafE family protein [Granulosicoccus sp.]